MSASRIVWVSPLPEIGQEIHRRREAIRMGVLAIAESFALLVQGYAQENAAWIDRTTNARQGLTGKAIPQGDSAVLVVLFHTMDYGKWLELRKDFEGRYAIILKAMQANYPSLMAELTAFIGG